MSDNALFGVCFGVYFFWFGVTVPCRLYLPCSVFGNRWAWSSTVRTHVVLLHVIAVCVLCVSTLSPPLFLVLLFSLFRHRAKADYWDRDFAGSHWGNSAYAKLLSLKDRYDPNGLFYGHHSVGSERWSADGNCRHA